MYFTYYMWTYIIIWATPYTWVRASIKKPQNFSRGIAALGTTSVYSDSVCILFTKAHKVYKTDIKWLPGLYQQSIQYRSLPV